MLCRLPSRVWIFSRIGIPLGLGLSLGHATLAQADPCRSVEVRFAPQGLPAGRDGREPLSPQIAIWVEDNGGKFLADVFVTKLVGLLGLGNRPGHALLKSDFRWPYGRRPMALPIWAYGRGKQYGYVVMGGKCSRRYNPDNPKDTTCPPDFTLDPSDDDTTIAYHGPVSSDEPFFCSPSGWRIQKEGGVDVVSCASSFFGSKGWYAPGHTSPYPPRADLQLMGANDHPDVMRFAKDNDVAVVSGATPPSGKVVEPPIRWLPPAGFPDGDYVLKVEVNIEGDFNASWPSQPGKAMDEPHREWNHLGKQFIGQPSILYKIPFRLEATSQRVTTTMDYAGYGDWSGKTGTVNPPDATISTNGGSGGDRLKVISDENGSWRIKVSAGTCTVAPCTDPQAPMGLDLSERSDSTATIRLRVPGGEPVAQLQVKYQPGSPITEENFARAMPATPPNLGVPGTLVATKIAGLVPQTKYYVAARAVNRCGTASPLVTGEVTTETGRFATLSGCFIATAAYGSPLEHEVHALRRFRDRHLLAPGNAIGQVAVASYYALGPALAGVIQSDERLRRFARAALSPLVRMVNE